MKKSGKSDTMKLDSRGSKSRNSNVNNAEITYE